MRFKIAFLAALALLSGAAFAADGTGFYVGADFGQANSDINKGRIDDLVLPAFDSGSYHSKVDKGATSYGVFVGYKFLPYLATELTYFGTGKANYNASGTVEGTPAHFKADWESKGPALSVIGILPFADVWDVYARVGVFFADTKITVKATAGDFSTGSYDQSANTTEFLWGVGAGYTFLDHWTARLEYQGIPNVGDKNKTDEFNVDRITLGMLYRF
ncbi:MAG TPA: outer membrane beta-barrel protein [Steroidobacteraceae bacterium]